MNGITTIIGRCSDAYEMRSGQLRVCEKRVDCEKLLEFVKSFCAHASAIHCLLPRHVCTRS